MLGTRARHSCSPLPLTTPARCPGSRAGVARQRGPLTPGIEHKARRRLSPAERGTQPLKPCGRKLRITASRHHDITTSRHSAQIRPSAASVTYDFPSAKPTGAAHPPDHQSENVHASKTRRRSRAALLLPDQTPPPICALPALFRQRRNRRMDGDLVARGSPSLPTQRASRRYANETHRPSQSPRP